MNARARGFLVLRIAAAMCFIGHGAFGLMTKEAWVAYFAVAGIGRDAAYSLMPLVGTADVLLGVSMLRPTNFAFAYMAAWAFWTALLRPLAGQGFAECLERAGNYGVPAALLVIGLGARPPHGWFAAVAPDALQDETVCRRVSWVLRLTTATLLLGHGLLAVGGKALLVKHLTAIARGPLPVPAADIVAAQGGFEIALAVAVLAAPVRSILVLALAWKIATELLFPFTGDSLWEFIERGGSYGAPLALLVIALADARRPSSRLARAMVVAPAS